MKQFQSQKGYAGDGVLFSLIVILVAMIFIIVTSAAGKAADQGPEGPKQEAIAPLAAPTSVVAWEDMPDYKQFRVNHNYVPDFREFSVKGYHLISTDMWGSTQILTFERNDIPSSRPPVGGR
jgi:hypothetical protein